jgi:hypothetical protein
VHDPVFEIVMVCLQGGIDFGVGTLSDNVWQMLGTLDKSVNQSKRLLGDYRTLN